MQKENSNAKITAWYTEIIPKCCPSCYNDDHKRSKTTLLMGYFTLSCDKTDLYFTEHLV